MFAPYNDQIILAPRFFMQRIDLFDDENEIDFQTNDFGNYSNRVEEIDIEDYYNPNQPRSSKKPELESAPVINLKKAKESLEKTLQLIQENNYKVEKISITPEALNFDNLITAANTGYKVYLESKHLTLFGNTSLINSSKALDMETSDHLLAIQLQNEEIQKFVSRKPGK